MISGVMKALVCVVYTPATLLPAKAGSWAEAARAYGPPTEAGRGANSPPTEGGRPFIIIRCIIQIVCQKQL